jgi:hypothetical protein
LLLAAPMILISIPLILIFIQSDPGKKGRVAIESQRFRLRRRSRRERGTSYKGVLDNSDSDLSIRFFIVRTLVHLIIGGVGQLVEKHLSIIDAAS